MRGVLLPLLIALLLAGCAAVPAGSPRPADPPPPSEPAQPAGANPPTAQPAAPVAPATQPAAPALPEPTVDLFPLVPRHPAAKEDSIETNQRVSMVIKGAKVGDLLAWYATQLEQRGWQPAESVLPPERVLLFAREGRYLSIVAYDITDRETAALLRLALRSVSEVTQAEAAAIASNTHQGVEPEQWIPTYIPDFESDIYGVSLKHPVWELKRVRERSTVTVWIDAITAEAFRIGEASDY